METKNVATMLVLGALGLAGCSAKVSTSGQTPNGDVPQLPGLTPAPNSQPVQAAATVLEGRWKLSCSAVPKTNLYTTGEVDFSGTTYSSIANMYMDPQCSQSLGSPDTQFGSFTLPAAGQINFTQANGEEDFNVYEIDQSVLFVGLQPSSDADSRPQTVDRTLGYAYAGAAVIVNN